MIDIPKIGQDCKQMGNSLVAPCHYTTHETNFLVNLCLWKLESTTCLKSFQIWGIYTSIPSESLLLLKKYSLRSKTLQQVQIRSLNQKLHKIWLCHWQYQSSPRYVEQSNSFHHGTHPHTFRLLGLRLFLPFSLYLHPIHLCSRQLTQEALPNHTTLHSVGMGHFCDCLSGMDEISMYFGTLVFFNGLLGLRSCTDHERRLGTTEED